MDIHLGKLKLLANNRRQSRADKLELLEPYFPRSVGHGLHRGAPQHVNDSTRDAISQFDEIPNDALINRHRCAPDGNWPLCCVVHG